ncbi:ABC transporter permease [Pelolinea submarina]|uniref:Peptide/nickel transport system permease protein n=1 Tax=Pelolinea submarina TaxID=913107 RepID=A0A347ZQH0_9CHLR|nr:ABC transporter permease [Pelolinea submarina]REG06119.1 peptide/nickel transport system permease protein [Pelolinea submarina]BBB47551.1 peptide/nickel transport system permease protein [Pelolinea submarina]
MGRYVVKRLIQTVFVLFIISTFVFLLLRAVGDPARLMVSPESTLESIDDLRRKLGLDRPLIEQYGSYMYGIIRGDFGNSYTYDRPALELIKMHIGPTLQLTLVSLLISLPMGLILGCISAIKRYSIFDNIATVLAVFSRAIPSFWLGIMMILVFSIRLKLLPPSGYGSPRQILMPALALGTSMAAVVARLTRSSMLEVLGSDFIRTARGKGLKERVVIIRHALHNALIPVVTIVGLQMGNLLGGSIIIETIFAWPGIGNLLVESINEFDFPVIQATVFIIAVFFVIINLITDFTYVVIDRRIRLE